MTWKLIRKDTQASVSLPDDMQWADEFNWSAIAQTNPVYSLTGAVLVQQGTKQAGRPITLSGDWVWHPLYIVRTLRDWSDVPELEMTLNTPDGRQFNVIFRTHDTALGKVEPVRYSAPPAADDQYLLTLNLMTF